MTGLGYTVLIIVALMVITATLSNGPMLARMWTYLSGHWFGAWSARADHLARWFYRRARRWRKKSEKFFRAVGRKGGE